MLDLCHDSCCLKHIQEPGTLVFSFTSLLQSPQSKLVKRCLLSAHFRITLGALCIQRAQTPSPTDPLPSRGGRTEGWERGGEGDRVLPPQPLCLHRRQQVLLCISQVSGWDGAERATGSRGN